MRPSCTCTLVCPSQTPLETKVGGGERERERVSSLDPSPTESLQPLLGVINSIKSLEAGIHQLKQIPKASAAEEPSNPCSQPPPDCPYIMHREGLHNHHLRTLSNQYFNTNIQKEFTPSVPGCIEHYTKLATAINEAHTHHKSLCICWLDLAKHLWKRTS